MAEAQTALSRLATTFDSLRDAIAAHGRDTPDAIAAYAVPNGGLQGDAHGAGNGFPTLTYRDLGRRARAVADGPLHGVPTGAKVLVACRPGFDFLAAFIGCHYAGVVPIPLATTRPRALSQSLSNDIAASGASLVLSDRSIADTLRAGLPPGQTTEIALVCEAGMAHSSAPSASQPPCDIAYHQRTSGSTGAPRAVVVGQDNLLANVGAIANAFEIERGWSTVTWLPPHHDMGLVGGLLTPLVLGQRTVIMSPTDFLRSPLNWLATVAAMGAQVSGAPNFAYDLCAARLSEAPLALPDGTDLSAWSVAFCGAEPVRRKSLDRFAAAAAPYGFRAAAFLACYGLAEATLFVSGARGRPSQLAHRFSSAMLETGKAQDAHPDARARELVSCGTPKPQDEPHVLIMGEDGAVLPDGRAGEIVVKGASVARGYQLPGQSELQPLGPNGMCATGDIGLIHKGNLYICGRLKDVLIRNGRNHAAADLEHTAETAVREFTGEALAWSACAFAVEAEDVAEAASVGRSSENDELIVVLLEPPRSRRAAAVPPELASAMCMEFSQEHSLIPDRVGIVRPGSLPRTTSGKLKRADARAAFLTQSLSLTMIDLDPQAPPSDHDNAHKNGGSNRPLRDHRETRLAAAVAAILGRPEADINLSKSFSAHGGASLEAVKLQVEMERLFGLTPALDTLLSTTPLAALLGGQDKTSRQSTARLEGEKARRDGVMEPVGTPATGVRGTDVLLTGATGLVGREVLTRLISSDASAERIIALVRPGRADAVLRGPEAASAAAQGRLVVLEADLSAPELGLSAEQRTDLAQTVGTILHCAAELSFTQEYDRLRAVNVVATRDLIALMAEGCAKHMVLMSSASVLQAPAHATHDTAPTYLRRSETSALPSPEKLPVAYARSKWAADALGASAQRAGFQVTIIRPPWIAATAAANNEATPAGADFLDRFALACLAVRSVPRGAFAWNVVDAGFVADVVLAAARLRGASVLHAGMQTPLPDSALGQAFQAVGISLEELPASEWLARTETTLRREADHPLRPLSSLFVANPGEGIHDPPVSAYIRGLMPELDSTATLLKLAMDGIAPAETAFANAVQRAVQQERLAI